MKLCRRCNAQFSDEHRRCVHCGGHLGPLEESPSTPGAPSASEGPDLSALYHLTDDHPSKIAPLLERLEEAGVAATLVTDAGTHAVEAYRGSSGWQARASVYVEPADRELAERLHREFLEELVPPHARVASPPAPDDLCPACHDPLPRAAEACPSCGLAFPDG